MSKVSILSNIEQNIHQNGTQAITGQVMQNVLKDMVNDVKTINGEDLFGGGNLELYGGGVIDTLLNPTTAKNSNAAGAKVTADKLKELDDESERHSEEILALQEILNSVIRDGQSSNFRGIVTDASSLPTNVAPAWGLVGSSLSSLQLYTLSSVGGTWTLAGSTTYDFTDYSTIKSQVERLVTLIGLPIDWYSAGGPNHSSPRFALKPNTTYKFYSTAGSGTPSGQIYLRKADDQYTRYFSLASTHTFTTTSEEVLASFYLGTGNTATNVNCIIEEVGGGLVGKIDILEKDVENLQKKQTGILDYTPKFSEVSGKYIDTSGAEAASAPFSYSTPFWVKKGDVINLYARGYLTYVAMIAKVNPSGSTKPYSVLVKSTESELKNFTYKATEDMQIAISWNHTFDMSVSVTTFVTQPKPYDDMAFAGIPKVGIIGDSLASGVTYKSNGTATTNYDKAWWQVLKRDSGAEYLYFAQGGMHTRSWHTNPIGWEKANTPGNECCAYIIGLAVNDQYQFGSAYVGTIADIHDEDYTQNADSYFGNYGKIIQKLTLKIPNAKFFLLSVPRNTGDYPVYNEAIREMAAHFSNCYLVDLERDYIEKYQSGYIKEHEFGGSHYSASAYQVMGRILEEAISKVMVDHALDFRYIQFALDTINQ